MDWLMIASVSSCCVDQVDWLLFIDLCKRVETKKKFSLNLLKNPSLAEVRS